MTNRTIAVLLFSTVLLAACGDDDGDTAGEAASAEAYCELAAELNAEGAPTDDQLDQLVARAPSEIRGDVETLVGALRSGESDDEVAEAEGNLTAFEEENCGGDLAQVGDGGDGDAGAPAVVTISSPTDGDTVSNPVIIEPNVVNAEIAPAAESGEGQGHYHVLIDTECVSAGEIIPKDENHVHFGDGSTSLELPDLEPGEHTLCLQLGDGTHQAFGAASTITIQVEG